MFPTQGMAAPGKTSYEEHISLLQGFKSHSYSKMLMNILHANTPRTHFQSACPLCLGHFERQAV